jgi:hypothetical protein
LSGKLVRRYRDSVETSASFLVIFQPLRASSIVTLQPPQPLLNPPRRRIARRLDPDPLHANRLGINALNRLGIMDIAKAHDHRPTIFVAIFSETRTNVSKARQIGLDAAGRVAPKQRRHCSAPSSAVARQSHQFHAPKAPRATEASAPCFAWFRKLNLRTGPRGPNAAWLVATQAVTNDVACCVSSLR